MNVFCVSCMAKVFREEDGIESSIDENTTLCSRECREDYDNSVLEDMYRESVA